VNPDLIVEADGGSRGNPGPAAFGAVVRDAATGDVLAETGEAIGTATNNVAEYRGLIGGLEAAREVRPDAVVDVRLDSKLVVEQMSGRWKIKNADLRPLADRAGSIFPRERVTYTWVPRAENTHADRLVNEALDGKTRTPASSAPPSTFQAPMLGDPVVAYLVRHGQTEMTAERRFSGGSVPGPPLSADGREEAERAAAWLAAVVPTAAAVVSSPMVRTSQTAAPIAARLGVDTSEDGDWRECEFGSWEGLTLAEVHQEYPAQSLEWYRSLSVTPPGGGESMAALADRVISARDRLIKRFDQRAVVVVTHSLVIRTLVRLTLEASPSAMWRVQPAPGSVTELRFYPDGEAALMAFSHRP
jgi:probable phosphoglycerate mutase